MTIERPRIRPGKGPPAGRGDRRAAFARLAVLALLAGGLLLTACGEGAAGEDDEPATQAGSGADERASGEAAPSGASAGGGRAGEGAEGDARLFPSERDALGVSVGSPDAPVVVREFGDYQCPACAHFAATAKRLREELVASGVVRYVFYDFPLSSVHPHAIVAAEAARCAGRQEAYWPMHDRLFERQQEWSSAETPPSQFRRYAEGLGLDAEALAECVESGATEEAVRESHAFASRIGVHSTPTVLVGERVTSDFAFSGSRPYEELRALVERVDRRSKAKGTPEDEGGDES